MALLAPDVTLIVPGAERWRLFSLRRLPSASRGLTTAIVCSGMVQMPATGCPEAIRISKLQVVQNRTSTKMRAVDEDTLRRWRIAGRSMPRSVSIMVSPCHAVRIRAAFPGAW